MPNVVQRRGMARVSTSRMRMQPQISALVLCLLAMMLRLTIFIRQRSGGEYAALDGAAIVQIGVVTLTLVFLGLNTQGFKRTYSMLRRTSGMTWLAYFALGGVMAVFSVSPAFAAYRSLEGLSQALALFVVLASIGNHRRTEKFALSLAWIVIVLDVIGAMKLAGWSQEAMASNSVSASAAMVACYSFGEMLSADRRRRMWLGISFVTAIGVVVFGMSLASWWSALLGLTLAGMLLRPHKAVIIALLLVMLTAVLWGPQLTDAVVLRSRPIEDLNTLHGRTFLWENYWGVYKERPIRGYGFAMGARLPGVLQTTNTHNAFFSVLLGCGAIGLLVMGWTTFRFVNESWRGRFRGLPGWTGCTAAIVCGIANSMSLGFLGEAWMPASFVFAAIFCLHVLYIAPAALTSRQRRRPRHATVATPESFALPVVPGAR